MERCAPYASKLHALPGFLREGGAAGCAELVDGMRLTGYFLHERALAPRNLLLPRIRQALMEQLQQQVEKQQLQHGQTAHAETV